MKKSERFAAIVVLASLAASACNLTKGPAVIPTGRNVVWAGDSISWDAARRGDKIANGLTNASWTPQRLTWYGGVKLADVQQAGWFLGVSNITVIELGINDITAEAKKPVPNHAAIREIFATAAHTAIESGAECVLFVRPTRTWPSSVRTKATALAQSANAELDELLALPGIAAQSWVPRSDQIVADGIHLTESGETAWVDQTLADLDELAHTGC